MVFGWLQGSDPVLKVIRASADRKSKAELALNFYNDKQVEDLYTLIARRWSEPDSFRLFFLNIVRKIVSKKAAVYARNPIRTVTGWDQGAFEALYQDAAVNSVLKRANRLTELTKTTVVQVRWDGDGVALNTITPNILDAVYADPRKPEKLVVTHIGLDATGQHAKPEHTEYSVWSADRYERLDWRGQPIPVDGNPDGVNPYRIIPMVPIWSELPDDVFFIEGGDDLIEAQRAVNVGLVNLWKAVELQSHGQAWAAGISAADALRTGPDRAITLPVDGTFGFAAPNTPIAEVLSALEFVIKQTAVANSLAANVFEIDPRAESGAAKTVENIDLLEYRADQIEVYRQYESKLFEVIKRVVNTHAPGSIPEAATIRVDFAEIHQTLDEQKSTEAARTRIDLGTWSPVDMLLRENPDIGTRAQALEELKRRRAETLALRPETAVPTGALPTVPSPTPAPIETTA